MELFEQVSETKVSHGLSHSGVAQDTTSSLIH